MTLAIPGGLEKKASSLRIGWASTLITTDRPVQLQGQFHERVSTGVHDPCTATVLALESGCGDPAAQAVMVSCDLANIPGAVTSELRRRVAASVPGLDARRLFMNATHTHTGPTLLDGHYPPVKPGVASPSESREFFLSRVTDAVAEAWRTRALGGVSWALGHAAVGFNRRVVYEDGTARMYGTSDTERFLHPEGGMDPGIEILFTSSADGTLTGVVVNIACPSQVVESEYFVSADFWHPAREELRKRLSPALFVCPMCSAAGDQSPRDLVRRNRGEPSMRQIEGMNELGRRIAQAVVYALETARSPVSRDAPLRHHVEELSLPRRKATAADAERARLTAEQLRQKPAADASYQERLLRRCRETIERHATQGNDPRYAFDLHAIRLGDIAIATNPFELYLDYGLRIKARSKARQTFVVQLANDRGLYLPTARAVAGGHYGAEVADNTVGPEGGQMLVNRAVELINGMWADGG